MPDQTDPRPQMRAALDEAQRQVEALDPDRLGAPTPCGEFDARTLVAHLVAVLRKLVTVRAGGDMTRVADPAVDLTDERAAFLAAREELETVWADDAALERDHTVAWGVMTGRELLDAYSHEMTVHAWDLAQVTGRVDELAPSLAEAALAWFEVNVPADERSPRGPFGPVVPVPDDADVYDRLAGFVGRSMPPDPQARGHRTTTP